MNRWIRLSSESAIDNKWFRVTADKCEVAPGRVVEPFFVVHESEWVHIVAMNQGNEVLTVRQYRYAADTFCVELPGGVVDSGESPEAAARRELLEETGHTARQWTYVGKLFANPARQTNSVHIFVATGLECVSSQNLDEAEEITWCFRSQEWIRQAMQAGEFSQALHVASFYRGIGFLGDRSDA